MVWHWLCLFDVETILAYNTYKKPVYTLQPFGKYSEEEEEEVTTSSSRFFEVKKYFWHKKLHLVRGALFQDEYLIRSLKSFFLSNKTENHTAVTSPQTKQYVLSDVIPPSIIESVYYSFSILIYSDVYCLCLLIHKRIPLDSIKRLFCFPDCQFRIIKTLISGG